MVIRFATADRTSRYIGGARRRAAQSILAACALLLTQVSSAGVFSWFTMTKTPSPQTFTAAGQVITYTYVINNSFNPGGSNNASITSLLDDKATVNINACASDKPPAPGF